MASVQVHFSPGFPLGGKFPAEQFATAWWYKTAGGEERLLWRRLLLRNSNARLRRKFHRELLQRYSELRREGNFPGSKLSGFCSSGIRNMQSTTCIPLSRIFLYSWSGLQHCLFTLLKIHQIYSPCFISRRAKSNTAGAKTALREILLHL
jgi:hypothetical protein